MSLKTLLVASIGLCGLAAAQQARAQQMPPDAPVLALPEQGHSAAYYGIASAQEREASIRTVLSSVQLDRPYLEPSFTAEASYFVIRMLLGGRNAPADIADPYPELALNP
jgi:hypothetical protein